MFRQLFAFLFDIQLCEGVPRSPHWPAVRNDFLTHFPSCAACGKREALQVHHIYPVNWPDGKTKELDPENLITLCESKGMNCHLRIGHLGDFKSRNADVRNDAAASLHKIQHRPYPSSGELE